MAKSKYNNIKTFVTRNGIRHEFDSKKEAKHFILLYGQYQKRIITDLMLQPEFDLIPTLKWDSKTLRKIRYIADFGYTKDGIDYVVDVKGFRTEVYKLKQRLFLMKYPEYTFVEI